MVVLEVSELFYQHVIVFLLNVLIKIINYNAIPVYSHGFVFVVARPFNAIVRGEIDFLTTAIGTE